jgi:hypothetical protein
MRDAGLHDDGGSKKKKTTKIKNQSEGANNTRKERTDTVSDGHAAPDTPRRVCEASIGNKKAIFSMHGSCIIQPGKEIQKSFGLCDTYQDTSFEVEESALDDCMDAQDDEGESYTDAGRRHCPNSLKSHRFHMPEETHEDKKMSAILHHAMRNDITGRNPKKHETDREDKEDDGGYGKDTDISDGESLPGIRYSAEYRGDMTDEEVESQREDADEFSVSDEEGCQQMEDEGCYAEGEHDKENCADNAPRAKECARRQQRSVMRSPSERQS